MSGTRLGLSTINYESRIKSINKAPDLGEKKVPKRKKDQKTFFPFPTNEMA